MDVIFQHIWLSDIHSTNWTLSE